MTILKPGDIETYWYDLCDDETIDSDNWTTSGSGPSKSATEYAYSIKISAASSAADGSSYELITKKDLLSIGKVFKFMAYCQAYSNSSATASLSLYDGSNSETLLSASTSGNNPAATGFFVLTISDDLQTVNVKRQAFSHANGDSTTVISNDTDVDISTWSKLQIRLRVASSNSGSGTRRAQAVIDKIEYIPWS